MSVLHDPNEQLHGLGRLWMPQPHTYLSGIICQGLLSRTDIKDTYNEEIGLCVQNIEDILGSRPS